MTNPAGTLVPREARDFGNYELVAKLATGGMAEIFLARRSRPDSWEASPPGGVGRGDLVVIKRILPHLADDEHFVTMFRDEAALASKLEHVHVCKVFALGQAQGTHFIVMEYLHGVALSRMLTRLAKHRQFLDLRMVGQIIIEACEGLHHAHELRGPDGHFLNVVHRDVSPPNIFLTADGVVKLLDFGIAKARGAGSKTRTGTVKGKNAYMSPEQILGKPLDRRSDVFALGAVMYELLAVKRLFHRDSDFLTFKAITEEPIPDIKDRRPDLPAAFREIVHRALARDVAARYPSAKDMADAVRTATQSIGGPTGTSDLSRVISADFSEELAAKAELCKSETLAPVDADSASIPSLTVTSGQHMAVAATVVDRPKRGNTQGPAEGELTARDRMKTPTRPPPIPGKVLSTIPTLDPSEPTPLATPAVIASIPSVPSPFPGPANVVAPLAIVPATGETMTGAQMATEINTDLLGAARRGFFVKLGAAAFALAAIVTLAIVIGSSGDDRKPAAAPDAGAPVVMPKKHAGEAPDAGPDKAGIRKYSRFGYLNVDADEETIIYIDNNRIGKTPIKAFPLEPGPHKMRADGPKKKKKFFDITIFGGQDLEWGMITWKP